MSARKSEHAKKYLKKTLCFTQVSVEDDTTSLVYGNFFLLLYFTVYFLGSTIVLLFIDQKYGV
jgi:hypothetical protein